MADKIQPSAREWARKKSEVEYCGMKSCEIEESETERHETEESDHFEDSK